MGVSQSILQRAGIRQLPGICWYPAKRTGHSVNQGGTADSVVLYQYLFVLDREYISVKDVFVLQGSFDERYKSKELFLFLKEVNNMMTKRWWRFLRRINKINMKVKLKPKPKPT